MRSRRELRGSKATHIFGRRKLEHLFLKHAYTITITKPKWENGKFCPARKLWIPKFIFERI